LNTSDFSLVQQIEADLAQSILVRNRIVTSNLRLLVSLAKKQTEFTGSDGGTNRRSDNPVDSISRVV